jgi:general secretion pathway protein L
MPIMKNVVGLDLGSHTIKAVELRQTLRGLEPVQLRVHPRSDSEIPLHELLRRFLRMHKLPTDHLVCAIASDRTASHRLEFPFRDRKKLAMAVPFAVEGQIPFDIEQVVVDWEIVGGDKNQALVAATIAQRSHVSQLLAELREASCEPRILEVEGLALANLASLFELPGTRLLVDLGHRKTTLCLLIDERPVAARSLPVAGHALTQAIARDRGFTPQDAEQSKCEDGIFQTGFESTSPGAIEVLDQISREIGRSLESLQTLLGGPPESQIAGLTLFGGSAKLHRLDEYLSEQTGIQATRLALPNDAEGAALVAGGDPLLFAPATALALRASARTRTHMNFRQQEFAYRTNLRRYLGRDLRGTAALTACVGLLALTSSAASISLDSRRANQLEAQAMQIYADVFPEAAPPDNPVTAMSAASREARERAEFLGVYGGNRSALDLLSELSKRVPDDLKVKFEEVTIDRRLIHIRVYGKSYETADRLVTELAREAPFERAKVDGEVSKKPRGEGVTFIVNIALGLPGDES